MHSYCPTNKTRTRTPHNNWQISPPLQMDLFVVPSKLCWGLTFKPALAIVSCHNGCSRHGRFEENMCGGALRPLLPGAFIPIPLRASRDVLSNRTPARGNVSRKPRSLEPPRASGPLECSEGERQNVEHWGSTFCPKTPSMKIVWLQAPTPFVSCIPKSQGCRAESEELQRSCPRRPNFDYLPRLAQFAPPKVGHGSAIEGQIDRMELRNTWL